MNFRIVGFPFLSALKQFTNGLMTWKKKWALYVNAWGNTWLYIWWNSSSLVALPDCCECFIFSEQHKQTIVRKAHDHRFIMKCILCGCPYYLSCPIRFPPKAIFSQRSLTFGQHALSRQPPRQINKCTSLPPKGFCFRAMYA